MIGIKDTLELSTTRHLNDERIADRIFGITKLKHANSHNATRAEVIAPLPNPLRQYSRSSNSARTWGNFGLRTRSQEFGHDLAA